MCYPNLFATVPHKLAPPSTPCVFLGYPTDHKGYRFLDLSTNRLIISHHVIFDESSFPFSQGSSPPSSDFDFLSEFNVTLVLPIGYSPVSGTTRVTATRLSTTAPADPQQAVASGPYGVPSSCDPSMTAAPAGSQQVVACGPAPTDQEPAPGLAQLSPGRATVDGPGTPGAQLPPDPSVDALGPAAPQAWWEPPHAPARRAHVRPLLHQSCTRHRMLWLFRLWTTPTI